MSNEPTPGEPKSSTTATPTQSGSPSPTVSTTIEPSPRPRDEVKDAGTDVSWLATLALFAGVIGVALGWALRESTAFFKERAAASRAKELAEQTRTMQLIHTAESLSGVANGLGVLYAATADGRGTDSQQLVEVVKQFNEDRAQLSRLRLEVTVLGPSWIGDKAVAVENAANELQTALAAMNRSTNKTSVQALIDEVGKYRQELIDAATAKYRGDASAPEVAQDGSPEEQPDES